MKRIRLGTLMLLVVIAGLCLTLVMAARREADLKARLAKSWPLFLKQQREDAELRQVVVGMQSRYRQELAKRNPAEARQQEGIDAELNRDIEAMTQRFREERAKEEAAKASETELPRPK
jgi:hypothetical protein